MPAYKTKTKIVYAVQWTGSNIQQIIDFMGNTNITFLDTQRIILHTLNGQLRGNPNDYVVKFVDPDIRFTLITKRDFENEFEAA